MRYVIAGILAVTLLASSGCSLNRSGKGGNVSSAEGDFRVTAPLLETRIRQGEVQTVRVDLQRGEYFNQDVRMKVVAPEGLSIEPSTFIVRASDKEAVQLVITADDHAALVSHDVEVQATPETGKATWVQFPVRVIKR